MSLISSHRRAGALAFAVALTFASRASAAPSKAECVAANENAQSERRAEKLRDARKDLLACAAKACPGPVREDCERRLAEVDRAMPTLVVTATDASGAELRSVVVTIDGERVTDTLDGTAFALDPGDHALVLEAAGLPRAERRVTLREGVKNREERVVLGPAAAAAAAAPVVAPSAHHEAAAPPSSGGGTQRTLGIVVGSAGVVGLVVGTYFGFKARGTYNDALTHCPTAATCDDAGAQGSKDAHSQATISTIGFAAGAILAAGGAVLWLTAPSAGDVGVAPTNGGATVALRRTW